MEKVQYALEGTLPELKDLHEKGLFSRNEINQISKRRTTFETALVRRVARKEDYFKYAEYEINLEQLRKVRWKRLGYDRNPPPPSASSFSFPRRIMYILKRATAKFSQDLSVWLAYVEYASREGMRKVVASGLTRWALHYTPSQAKSSALQHHPTSPTLYLLSSYHHLHPTAPFPTSIIPSSSSTPLPSAAKDEEDDAASGFAIEGTQVARTTLLLGLRMIPHYRDLWREYIKLELGWVEALRRRWKILGIDVGKGRAVDDEELLGERDGGEGAFGPEGEDARKAILGGQLVIHAIQSALAKISAEYRDGDGDGMEFRQTLLDVFRIYPSPLRKVCLEEVYSDLEGLGKDDEVAAKARLMLVTKSLYDRAYEPGRKDVGGIVLEGEALVDAYGKVGQKIRQIAKNNAPSGWSDAAGTWLCEQVAVLDDSPDLGQYLTVILGFLCKAAYHPSPSLLARHLDILSSLPSPSSDLIVIARAHAAQHPSDPVLALRRMIIERSVTPPVDASDLRKAYSASIKACTRASLSPEQVEAVTQLWLDYAEWEESQAADLKMVDATWRRILRDSLRTAKDVPGLNATLLYGYLSSRMARNDNPALVLKDILGTYGPPAGFYDQAFAGLAGRLDLVGLAKLYESWRAACKTSEQRINAAIKYSTVLLQRGKAKGAVDTVDVVRRELRDDVEGAAELESRWKAVLDADTQRADAASDPDSDSDADVEGNGDEEEEEEEGSMDVDLHVDT